METFLDVIQKIVLIITLVKWWDYKCKFMGLVAYMIEHRLQIPDKKQMKEYTIYAGTNLLKDLLRIKN
ncbi:hypothetical protein [Clostridium sp. MD294]|uniref:hypothetical protein n=1 Tax=Clostridium sp. MD294 TaxID=97138 RepID=UPI0002CA8D06|nr:hypothetical protein [Clostridium sp. MD294]NDO45849.1 hypothetical protein [Clostridium sp. MD294]USF30496.1 hypothetical protein C820_001937 [Clostridium sp. MD294]